jgi:hypothetical protein
LPDILEYHGAAERESVGKLLEQPGVQEDEVEADVNPSGGAAHERK